MPRGFASMFVHRLFMGPKKKISAKRLRSNFRRSDNIHEAMLKSQEAGVAFNLMIEVRNKLVDSQGTYENAGLV